ncbi:MAG TPA: hypothetical protein VFR24_12475 [Candidatus Angelobacter sp.]|nr:hypothetical protein [Candidatus Angelobacter sp.]
MPENQIANCRLDSWKEIAEYLKRDVRTAIRWEKDRGLPVHRVPGGKRQAVFAYPDEINAWLGKTGSAEVEPASLEEENPTASDITEGSTNPIFLRRWKLFISSVCLLIIGLAGWFLWPGKTKGLHVVSFRQLTDDGWQKASLKTDGATLYFNVVEGARVKLASAPISGSPIRLMDVPFTNVSLQDLSQDGKALLVFPFEGISIEGPLWIMPTGGGIPQPVSEVVCNFARWSPDNKKIACAHGTTITVMNADGSNVRTIGAYSGPVRLLDWTPDGRRLRFVLEQATEHKASQWETSIDEGTAADAHALNLGTNCCWSWTWTHDAKNFVYSETDEKGKQYVKIQTGGSPSQIYELPINIGFLWMATPGVDANSLFLLIGNSYRGELLKFDSKQQALQSYLPGLSAVFIAFSPDGQWITYANTMDNTLWRSRADGTDALQLTRPPMQVEVSSWSPDGRHIAFMACTPGKPWRIYLIDRNGGQIREISEGTDGQGGPSWSPDGRFIVYGNVDCEKTQNCWIRKLELATEKTVMLPESNGMRTARWSPNGKYIAALRFQTHDLMLFNFGTQQWKVLAKSVSGDNVNWSSDSQYVYVDSPEAVQPRIERVRTRDGHRQTVLQLDSLQKAGLFSPWFGLTPDNAPILGHLYTGSEVYELKWTEP